MTTLILPGYDNSGPTHWQSLWERADDRLIRVQQDDWQNPECAQWARRLDEAIGAAPGDVVLVGHSLGSLLAVFRLARRAAGVRAALLVAVPDPAGPAFPAAAKGFDEFPRQRLPVPTVVVASSDDPYAGLAFSRACARDWGSEFVELGAYGHINGDSGLRDWPWGREQLARLWSV